MPTLLEAANVKYPDSLNGSRTQPLDGYSLLPVFKGEKRPEHPYLISGWTEKFRMYIEGDWKIVKVNGLKWELYNLKNDPTEIKNLAEMYTERVIKMEENYKSVSNTNEK